MFALQIAMRLRGPVEYTWTLAAIQGFAIIATSYWIQIPPSPGIAVGVLGLVAVVMTVRAEDEWGRTERIAWLLLALCLMVVEIRAIQFDRSRQDALEAQNRKDETERFSEVLKDNREKFDATMSRTGEILGTTQRVGELAQENLENTTGGKSFAAVTPQVWSGTVPISLSIYNYGKQTLTGVTVSIYGSDAWHKPRGFFEAPTIDVGTLHAGEMKLLKETITPTDSGARDGGLKMDSFQLYISAQNFTVVEHLLFREGKQIPWTFRYIVTRQFIKSQHGKITNLGYEIMANQKEWLGEK